MTNQSGRKAWVGAGLGLMFTAMVVLLLSCDTATRTTSLLPGLEGREYVGRETCAGCHQDQVKKFELSSHNRMSLQGDNEGLCESCHGPGSLHVEGGGDKAKIVNPRDNPQMCVQCHAEKQAQFQMQFHHPVMEGRMSCSDCHDVHGEARASSATALRRPDEKCFKCHKETKGPYVFEHDAMRDGCPTCHNPHGSVYDKLLTADKTTLCVRCHWEQNFNTVAGNIGGVPHGTAGYDIGQGEECVDHHRAPHGSNIWRTFNR